MRRGPEGGPYTLQWTEEYIATLTDEELDEAERQLDAMEPTALIYGVIDISVVRRRIYHERVMRWAAADPYRIN